jgi:cyclic-di-GMP phosphodiesterase, flagellum assembly factor TipF
VGAVFLLVVLVLGAGSLGGALYRFFAFSGPESAVAAIAVVVVLGLLQMLILRARDRAQFGDRVADLSRVAADLARQVAGAGQRLAAAETEIARSAERTRAALEPTAAEIELLRRSAKELAKSVAAHGEALQGLRVAAGEPGNPAVVSRALEAMREPELLADAALAGNGAEVAVLGGAGGAGALRRAVEAGRFELYLQPIVTLPQRKVRYFEAMPRLRGEDGELLDPCGRFDAPDAAQVAAMVDDILLFRCVQVARRLMAREREIGVFCAVAGRSLLDPAFLARVSDFIEANRALAPRLVFEFGQRQIRAIAAIERECLSELATLGFRFAIRHVGDLVLDARELAELGFRFVKIPAALLLDRGEARASGVVAADLADRLGRFGIDLIAEEIERDSNVVDLLDFDVRFGQGPLFSRPRPVRADVVPQSPDLLPPRASGTVGPTAAALERPAPAPTTEPFAAGETPQPIGMGLTA